MATISKARRKRLIDRLRIVAEEHRAQPDIDAMFLKLAEDFAATSMSPLGTGRTARRVGRDKLDDPEQSKRFIEMAREVETAETEEEAERASRTVAKEKPDKAKR